MKSAVDFLPYYEDHIDGILNTKIALTDSGATIGVSREGRKISGYTFGQGPKRISLIAGNHADEPVGPRLLRKLVQYFSTLPQDHELFQAFSWWIVPHTNPDGEHRNRKWYSEDTIVTDMHAYLTHVIRELPGEDLEFGYAIAGKTKALRPENEAVYAFWQTANAPFHLHVSLHGMMASSGPWFLIDESWIDRTEMLRSVCIERTKALGYTLFDLDRGGEKGFLRIAKGFCTRPDSEAMKQHFLAQGDTTTASKFYPSSMESIRSLGGDCLTLVSEMPLFLYPNKERTLTWPDSYIDHWKAQFTAWKAQLLSGTMDEKKLAAQMNLNDVIPMSWEDQMRLQWQLICAGLRCI